MENQPLDILKNSVKIFLETTHICWASATSKKPPEAAFQNAGVARSTPSKHHDSRQQPLCLYAQGKETGFMRVSSNSERKQTYTHDATLCNAGPVAAGCGHGIYIVMIADLLGLWNARMYNRRAGNICAAMRGA